MTAEPVTFECVVSADLFSRAQMAVSKEGGRYYLNGVQVSAAPDGGAILAATDGSMLLSFHDPDAFIMGEAIVQLDKAVRAALDISGILLAHRLLLVRAYKGGRSKIFVVDQPRGAPSDENYVPQLAARDVFDDPDKRVQAAQFGPAIIDGKFPDWRRVLPGDMNDKGVIPTLDQAKLTVLAKALSPRKAKLDIAITSSGRDPRNSPMLITSVMVGAPAGFGILMPLRTEPKTQAVPAWARLASPKAA